MASSTTAGRARPAPFAAVRSVPAWAWVAALATLSAVVHYALGRRVVAPWIFVDELIYSELAKGIAAGDGLTIRGVDVGAGYGVLYPLAIAPAYALFDSLPAAYAAAKAINAVLMSLAAIPVYLLARRVVAPALAVVAAALTVALPGLLYAGTLMTENLFFPLFLTAVLALVLALERPTAARALAFLGVTALAALARSQAVVLLPALLTAPLLLVAYGGGPLRRFRWLYGIPAAVAALVLAVQAARGRSPLDLLGAYRAAGEADYSVSEALRWLLYHVAELDLALGIVPLAALVLVALLARRLEPGDRPFVAGAVAVSGWLVLQVAVFASRHSLRVEERNMFYVMPLALIATLLWLERGLPRPRVIAAAVAAAVAVLPAFLPFPTLIATSAVSDTFGLLPWWDVHHWGIVLDRLWIAALVAGVLGAGVFLLLPARGATVALPVLLLAFLLVTTPSVESRIRTAAVGALFQGITNPERDWIDRALPEGAVVAAVWSGREDSHLTIYENELFNRAVGPVYTLAAPLPGGLPQSSLAADDRTGVFRGADGDEIRAAYALVDTTVPVAGAVVARDEPKSMQVVRLDGPLRLAGRVTGTYDDGWSGPEVTYTRYRCGGGSLLVAVESDARLFDRPQTIVARVGGRVAARARIPVDGRAQFTVPLTGSGGDCVVRFAITPAAVPAEVLPGNDDTRELGTHFRRLDYRP